jgi:hypothetical protein
LLIIPRQGICIPGYPKWLSAHSKIIPEHTKRLTSMILAGHGNMLPIHVNIVNNSKNMLKVSVDIVTFTLDTLTWQEDVKTS